MKRFVPALILLISGCAGAQLAKQKQQLDELREKAGALLVEVKTKSDAADAAEAKAADLEGKLAIANAQIESLTKSNKQLADAVGASQDDLGGKLNEAVAQKDALAKKFSDLQKEKLTLDRLKNIYRSARDKAAADSARLQAERDALLAQLSSAKDSQSKSAEEKGAAAAKIHEDIGAVVDAILPDVQAGKASAAAVEGGFNLTVDNAAFFDDASAKIRDDGSVLLEKLGAALKALGPREILISAHTDNAPVKKGLLGGFEDNWSLSAGRAAAIARWLHQHAGLDPAHLKAQGCGEFHPLKPNDSDAARAGNRRVVVSVRSAGTP